MLTEEQIKKFKSKVEVLLRDERVNYICEADYTEGSELDSIIKLIIKKMSVVDELSAISVKQRKEMEID